MAKIKLIIFDFDGTLADTKELWYSSILNVLRKERVFCPECEAKIIIHFGRKIKSVLDSIETDEKRAKEINKKIHKIVLKKRIKLVPGIKEIDKIQKIPDKNFLSLQICHSNPEKVNQDLKIKIKKVVVSNSITPILKKALKNYKFDGIYGGDLFKTKEQFFKKLFKKYRIKSHEAVYVGDRAGDVAVARKAGCLSVIISGKYAWNTHEEIMRAKPDYILSNLGKISMILN